MKNVKLLVLDKVLKLQLLHVLLLATCHVSSTRAGLRDEVKARAGSGVTLRCAVNKARCGDFHSIKWYKENRRVYVYSPVVDFSKAEGELLSRGSLALDDEEAALTIAPVQTTDEGEYKCEITFLDISKNCPVVQLVKLTTLAPPRYANISLATGSAPRPETERKVETNSVVGPYNEGTDIVLICESGGGKPIPQVTWYINNQQVAGKGSSSEEADRTGTGRSELSLTVDRSLLGASFECRADNEAVAEPLVSSVQLDVSLRPDSLKISGAERAFESGNVVSLVCVASAARPAAVLTWYNGSALFRDQPAGQVTLGTDGTYMTSSRLTFIASRFEDNEKVYCEANNEVLEYYKEEPMRSDTRLEVRYAPVVTIAPVNVTVNETDEVIIRCSYESNPSSLVKVRWYHNGKMIDTMESRYEGGSLRQPSLKIRSVTKTDIGTYSCVLENDLGSGTSDTSAYLDVFYPPRVSIRMAPVMPISEPDRTNVTLFCDISEGNPPTLTSVQWFMDGDLLKELPQCGINNNELCDIDPSKLLLEHVSRHFHGNFSCVGSNAAGSSLMSASAPLLVNYAPGNATITSDTENIVKGDRLVLTCDVGDLGRPEARDYEWVLAGHTVGHVTSRTWTISPVTLETQSSLSCAAVNKVGRGNIDTKTIEVSAPPSFIESLHPYTGFTATSRNVSLLCQVECSPLCDILWLKDGVPITDNSDYFTIRTRQVPPNYSKNDFESVKSVLAWNLENWPQGRLSRSEDNSNFTCKTSSNGIGPGVTSSTHFRVEYPPDNLFISQEAVNVIENTVPDKVLCTADSYPEASFMWKFNDEIIQTQNLLSFGSAITRHQAGLYVCEAANRHGTAYVTTKMNVLYKPDCSILQEKIEDQILLTCVSDANPDQVSFAWKKGNETFDSEVSVNGLRSSIKLGLNQESFGTYYCYVNNSVGLGVPCEIDIQGIGVLKNISDTNIIVIGAVIAAGVVALVILVLVILVCKRRASMGEKCPGLGLSSEAANKEAEVSEAITGTQPQQTGHKWPLRPGVHVHVNGLNTLTGGSDSKVNHQISGFTYGAKTSRSSSSSGSDWASNTSSNPDLNNSEGSEGKKSVTGKLTPGLSTHQEMPSDHNNGGTRPSSRQRRHKGEKGGKSLAHISGSSDQLLPTFYENVSSIQNRQKMLEERLRDSRSHSPALTDIARLTLARPEPLYTRPASAAHAHDTRPSSQLSAHTLHSGRSRGHKPRPLGVIPYPGPGARYSALQGSGRQKHDQRKLDLAEAELESNPDRERDTNQDVMIEYSAALSGPGDEVPLFSSLNNFKSLPRAPAPPQSLRSQFPGMGAAILLSEPISPPRQFDSSYPSYNTHHGASGLRVQPHSIHGPGGQLREGGY